MKGSTVFGIILLLVGIAAFAYDSISYTTEEQVVLELYDATGRLVRTLADRRFDPGTHALELGSDGLNPGLYTYRLLTSRGSSTRQMLIL